MSRFGLLVLAAALLPVPGAAFAAGTIQPGMELVSEFTPCTGAWVFDGTDPLIKREYIITAAHCTTHVGEAISTPDGVRFGTVVLRGDDSGKHGENDVALIEIQPDAWPQVDPAMSGHPDIPAGALTKPSDLKLGDVLQFSGYGLVVGDVPTSREGRVGAATVQTPDYLEYYGPTVNGDSGGPIALRDSKRAVAMVSRLCASSGAANNGELSGQCAGSYGPTVDSIVRYAAQHGIGIALRTVAG